MEDIKPFGKNEQELETQIKGNENKQSGHKNRIWLRKMCHADSEKREIT